MVQYHIVHECLQIQLMLGSLKVIFNSDIYTKTNIIVVGYIFRVQQTIAYVTVVVMHENIIRFYLVTTKVMKC